MYLSENVYIRMKVPLESRGQKQIPTAGVGRGCELPDMLLRDKLKSSTKAACTGNHLLPLQVVFFLFALKIFQK